MADLIDLTDLIDDPKLAAAAKERILKTGNKFTRKTGVKAKRYAPEPFKPRGLYTGRVRQAEMVMIYDIYTCTCSNSWAAPRYSNETYNQIADTTHKAHLEPAEHTLRNYTRVEQHQHRVTVCPACLNDDRTCTDPTLMRMFDIKPADHAQEHLDFDTWLHAPKEFPLTVVSPPINIRTGVMYARHTLATKPADSPTRYYPVDRNTTGHYCTPCPVYGSVGVVHHMAGH
jgi:hypothetical protein